MGNDQTEDKNVSKKANKVQINWPLTAGLVLMHIFGFYGLFLILQGKCSYLTFLYTSLTTVLGGLGTTVGAHRYWTDRTFKAKRPLKLILILLQTMAAQRRVWFWVAIHRIHHKNSDTDKDPHNSKRGFWHSHICWLVTYTEAELYESLKVIDMSDMDSDPYVTWQRRHYYPLVVVIAVILPTLVPCLCWKETLEVSFFVTAAVRILYQFHVTMSVNSVAHMLGSSPYDKNISPRENKWVALLSLGEGWHNFHHTFPTDYRTSEYGGSIFSISTLFIDFFSCIGWAYDLKITSTKIIRDRAKRTGDLN